MPDINNLDDILTQAAGGVPTPDPEPDDVTNTADEQTTTADEQTTTVVTPDPKQTEVKPDPKNNPIKEVRERLNVEQKAREKIDKTINRFTSGDYSFKLREFKTEDGKVDYDALTTAMDESDTKVKADAKGISPEVQAEIERIESEKTEIRKEKLRISMDKSLTNMQIELGLKSADINQFFKDSLSLKKNPYQWLDQGGDIKDLYYFVYRDKLEKEKVDKAVADARTKWEEELSKQGRAPLPNPAASQKTTGATSSTGLSMEQLLQEAANRKKK